MGVGAGRAIKAIINGMRTLLPLSSARDEDKNGPRGRGIGGRVLGEPPMAMYSLHAEDERVGDGLDWQEREMEEGNDAKRLHGDARASVHDEGRVTSVGCVWCDPPHS
jgi:hypothetical protein